MEVCVGEPGNVGLWGGVLSIWMQRSRLSLQSSNVAVFSSRFNLRPVNASGIVHTFVSTTLPVMLRGDFLALASFFHLVSLYFYHSITVEGDYCSSVSTLKVFKMEFCLFLFVPPHLLLWTSHLIIFIFG